MTSKYKGVSKKRSSSSNSKDWLMSFTDKGQRIYKRFANERDAAKAYDILRLKSGMDAVNILKPKKAA